MREQGGHEVALERAGGACSFEMDAGSEGEGERHSPKKAAKAFNQHLDADEPAIVKGFFDALWGAQEHDETQSTPCEPFFARRL